MPGVLARHCDEQKAMKPCQDGPALSAPAKRGAKGQDRQRPDMKGNLGEGLQNILSFYFFARPNPLAVVVRSAGGLSLVFPRVSFVFSVVMPHKF